MMIHHNKHLQGFQNLGPSVSASSYFPLSAHQTRRIEETEPKSDISQHEHKEESTSDDQMQYKN